MLGNEVSYRARVLILMASLLGSVEEKLRRAKCQAKKVVFLLFGGSRRGCDVRIRSHHKTFFSNIFICLLLLCHVGWCFWALFIVGFVDCKCLSLELSSPSCGDGVEAIVAYSW